MISVDFEKLKELYEIVNRFQGTVSENLSRAEAETSGITADGDKLIHRLNEIKCFLDDEITRYQRVERKLNENANAITFRGSRSLKAVYINNISESSQSLTVSPNAALFKSSIPNDNAAAFNMEYRAGLKSEDLVNRHLRASEEKVNSTVNMVENAANELKNFVEDKIEAVENKIKNIEEYIKSELAELTRQINSVLEEIFKTFENKNFQKAGTDFLVLLAVKVEELTTKNKEELKVLPKFEAEYENNLSKDFNNFKKDVWDEFSKNHPEGAKLLKDTSNKIDDLEEIIKKSWEIYKKVDPKHAGILAGAGNFVKETVEIPYDVAEFCGKQWYNLRTDTKGTLLNWLDNSQKIYGLLNPQMPKTAEQLEFEGNLFDSIKNSVDKNFINGDEYTRAKFGTEVVLNIATLFSGKGVLKAASEADKVGDVIRISEDASKLSKLEKGTSYAEKMSELSSKLKGIGKASEEMFKNTLSEILSLQKSMSDKFGDIVEKLKGVDKEVEIKSEAKEIAEVAEKSEVEEKTVNDIIIEKNEVGSPAKVNEDIKTVNVSSDEGKIENNAEKESTPKNEQLKDAKDSGANEEINTKADEGKGVGESSKIDSKNAEEVNVETKTDEVDGKEDAKGVSNSAERDLDSKYFKDSFSSQDEFKNFMDNIFKDDSLTSNEKAFINRENFAKLTDAQKTDLNTLGNDKFLKVDSNYKNWQVVTKTGDSYVNVPYDWPDYMGIDLSKDVEVLSAKNMPKIQERIGTLGGNNFSPLKNEATGECFNMSEKSIECYIDNTANAQHLYNIDTENYIKAIDCISDSNTVSATDKLNNLIDEMNIGRSKSDLIEHVTIDDMKSYQNSYIKFKKDAIVIYDKKGIMYDSNTVFYGLKGQAAPWLSSSGGAGQINTPIKGYMMEDLGLLK